MLPMVQQIFFLKWLDLVLISDCLEKISQKMTRGDNIYPLLINMTGEFVEHGYSSSDTDDEIG